MSSELKISDAEYVFAEQSLIAYLSTMAEAGSDFQKVIESVVNNALEDPLITSKLGVLSEKMSAVTEKAAELTETLNGEAHDFIAEIDEKDQFIY
ncbi:hypothetical protein I6N96_04825 [Enterococcus sp. BWM-S5]|uniref:Uncharacterized protein n=1 Tax=Enterococcus larvae TaxID=2794352 RepID=A0ABS4CGA9_9ENTE|nr:hypothetical protein [Enterococcus larvae]MBP1045591.1 hypothetical protein [Enterococcus larvae]